MRIEWLNKKSGDLVVVFFNGWGMDGRAVSHLKTEMDVVMCYDYRDINDVIFPSLRAYKEVYIVAWSMGVWAASNLLSKMNLQPLKLVCLNGTERPVNDEHGIPVKIYQLTEKGMTEKGREKFLRRMLDGVEESKQFEQNRPQRLIEEVCEELTAIRMQSASMQNELKWDKIYISDKDVIFPMVNQQNWWQERCNDIQIISGGHYPFYQFKSWEEIIGINK